MLEPFEQAHVDLGIMWPLPRRAVLPTPDRVEVRYTLVDSEESLLQMAEALKAARRIAWDTETSGLKPELGARICGWCFAHREASAIRGYYVPVRHIGASNTHRTQLDPELVANVLRPVLAKGPECVTHHGKFERKMARADRVELGRRWVDLSILALAANENEPSFALKKLMAKYGYEAARDEEHELDQWMRRDARRLGLPYKKVSPAARKAAGLDGHLLPTYMDRFGYSRTPIDLCARYGIHDAVYTLWLREQVFDTTDRDWAQLVRREHAISDLLFEMEWWGLPADVAEIRRAHEMARSSILHWFGVLRAIIPKWIPEEWSASDAELRELFYDSDRMGLTPPAHTEKGEPSTARSARAILRTQHPKWALVFFALEQLIGEGFDGGRSRPGLVKIHSTYAGNYLKYYSPRTGCIHPSYNQLERRAEGGFPVTGRLNSSDPNAQNINAQTIHMWNCRCTKCVVDSEKRFPALGLPPKTPSLDAEKSISVRRYFVVRDGWIRFYIDFSQIELRVLAWFCQDANLLRAYVEGTDVHQLVADMLGIDRKIAKQVNFGNSFGMTEKGLALRMPGYYADPQRTEAEAKHVLQNYFRKFPAILRFRQRFADAARRNGGAFVNPFGRPRRIPMLLADGDEMWKRKRAERMMMSSIISGTAADLMKESMLRTDPIIRAAGGRIVQTIHDEAVFDMPMTQDWPHVLRRLKAAMEDWPFFAQPREYEGVWREAVPIEASVEISTTTWEAKRELEVRADGTFAFAA